MLFESVSDVLDDVQKTSKRLEKTKVLAEFLTKAKKENKETFIAVCLFFQGKVFAEYDQTKIGVSDKLLIKAIAQAAGTTEEKVNAQFLKLGDLGAVAHNLAQTKKQTSLFAKRLDFSEVIKTVRKLATMTGKNSVQQKVSSIAGLLGNATPGEARHVANVVLEQLRVGSASGVVRDASVWCAFPLLAQQAYPEVYDEPTIPENAVIVDEFSGIDAVAVNRYSAVAASKKENAKKIILELSDAIQASGDVQSSLSSACATLVYEGTVALKKAKIKIFVPFHAMLAQKIDTIEDAFETLGTPVFAEYKYDGFRMQIHKQGKKIRLFTRRLEEVTEQFPDVVAVIGLTIKEEEVILDAEVVGVDKKTKKYIAFQAISQRIRRKYDIHELAQNFPVDIRVFDVTYIAGEQLLFKTLNERRALVEKIVPKENNIGPSTALLTNSSKEVQKFFEESLAAGNEGIMLKRVDSPYQPGSRVGFMLKYKPTMENLDVIIIGATWGEGKRSQWLTSFTIACKDHYGELVEVGRVSTGLKELDTEGTSFNAITNMLKPLIIKEEGKEAIVKSEIVIEVAYEEIQKSPSYSSGYALRFPRFVQLREDRGIDDISDLSYVEVLYRQQRGRSS